MKRRDLIRRVGEAARAADRSWVLIREGAEHEVWGLNAKLVTIPRHREINEVTARAIFEALESELGEGWWRR